MMKNRMLKQFGISLLSSVCLVAQAGSCEKYKEKVCVSKCCQKIGVVNLSEVYEQFYPAQQAQERFDLLIQQANAEHEKMLQEGKPLFEKRDAIIKKLEVPALMEKAKKELEEQLNFVITQIQKQGEKIAQFQQGKEEKLHKDRQDVLSKNFKELSGVVEQIGKEEGYDLILNETCVLYTKPCLNITKKVSQISNQPYRKQIELAKQEAEKKKKQQAQ